jgi:hypothetical protein
MLKEVQTEQELPERSTLRECRQFINDLFVSNSGEGMKFVERILYKLEPKTSNFEIQRHFLAEEAFSFKSGNLVKSINQKIIESKWASNNLMRYFKPESVIQVGQKLDSLNDLEKLNVMGKNHKINIEEGKIYLIYIWSFYKPICKKQLSWLNSLFQKKNWENSASFITINIDKNRQYATKLIKILQCERFLENYYIDLMKFPNHPLFDVANKYGYPTSILVNNDGIIELCGSIFEINLEEKVDSLLKRQRKKKDIILPGVLNEETLNDLKFFCRKNLQKKVADRINDVNAYHLYGATIKIKYTYKTNKNNNFIDDNLRKKIYRECSAELDYFSHTSDINIFDDIFNTITSARNNMIITRNIVDTYEIPYIRTPICSLCKKACIDAYSDYFIEENRIQEMYTNIELPETEKNENNNENNENNKVNNEDGSKGDKKNINIAIKREYSKISNSYDEIDDEEDNEKEFNSMNYFAYYYCGKCNKIYCYKCGNEMTDIKTVQKMHKHFMFYLTSNNRLYSKYILKFNAITNHDLDFRYFIGNAKTEKMGDIAIHYMVKCDACLQFPIRTIRWKCCNCFSKNLCDKCKSKIENKEEGYEELLWNLINTGCKPNQHVFMKILFDCFAY